MLEAFAFLGYLHAIAWVGRRACSVELSRVVLRIEKVGEGAVCWREWAVVLKAVKEALGNALWVCQGW